VVWGKASWQKDLVDPPDGLEAFVEVPIRCSNCNQLYVAVYESHQRKGGEWASPSFLETVPATIAPTLPSKTIMKIAPSFSKIYDEAVAAESAGLKELLGAGYRRALEALVKEYLTFKNPARAGVYKRTALANCIKDHIDHDTIKELAEKAVSVGNDFTHFEKRGVHEIADLKGLIALVRRWIELQEETALVRARLISPDVRPPELRTGSVVDDFRSESAENDRE
jgi:hypothetical protein